MGCRMPFGPRMATSGSAGKSASGAAIADERSMRSVCALALASDSGLCSACHAIHQGPLSHARRRSELQAHNAIGQPFDQFRAYA
jgi:hypothetical protein